MLRLGERQRGFATALLDGADTLPAGLVGPDGEPSARRFGVYRNNMIASLTSVLEDTFPAVCRIVGEEFFRAMARLYVRQSPPQSPMLLHYGADFADFISRFEPAAALPYLPDVARIERAWNEAYHAAEARPVEAQALSTIEADGLADLRFALHPSLRIVRSPFPTLTIWRMNVDDGVPGPVDLGIAEDALIVRPAAEVEVRSMPPGGAEFLFTLLGGSSLGEAAAAGIAATPRFDLKANLVGLMGAGVFTGFSQSESEALAGAQ